jgi:lysozyme family protein
MPQLTWRNVDQPNFSGVTDARQLAANLLNNAFSAARGTLDRVQADRVNDASNRLMAAVIQAKDQAGVQNAVAGFDPTAVSADVLKFANNQAGVLLDNQARQDVHDLSAYTLGRTKKHDEALPGLNAKLALLTPYIASHDAKALADMVGSSDFVSAASDAGYDVNTLLDNALNSASRSNSVRDSGLTVDKREADAADDKQAGALATDVAGRSLTQQDAVKEVQAMVGNGKVSQAVAKLAIQKLTPELFTSAWNPANNNGDSGGVSGGTSGGGAAYPGSSTDVSGTASVPAANRDAIITFVRDKLEGGDKIVDLGDGAGITRFGITQKNHPREDVKNLTGDRASEILKSEYWDAVGGDQLLQANPALAISVFDAAVNQGQGAAKQMLAQSGGDVAKFNQLRRERYAQTQGKERFGAAWADRMRKIDAIATNYANQAAGSAAQAGADGIVVDKAFQSDRPFLAAVVNNANPADNVAQAAKRLFEVYGRKTDAKGRTSPGTTGLTEAQFQDEIQRYVDRGMAPNIAAAVVENSIKPQDYATVGGAARAVTDGIARAVAGKKKGPDGKPLPQAQQTHGGESGLVGDAVSFLLGGDKNSNPVSVVDRKRGDELFARWFNPQNGNPNAGGQAIIRTARGQLEAQASLPALNQKLADIQARYDAAVAAKAAGKTGINLDEETRRYNAQSAAVRLQIAALGPQTTVYARNPVIR